MVNQLACIAFSAALRSFGLSAVSLWILPSMFCATDLFALQAIHHGRDRTETQLPMSTFEGGRWPDEIAPVKRNVWLLCRHKKARRPGEYASFSRSNKAKDYEIKVQSIPQPFFQCRDACPSTSLRRYFSCRSGNEIDKEGGDLSVHWYNMKYHESWMKQLENQELDNLH